MEPTPYTRFVNDDFTLRDFLAIDRTVLANERTFLAYVNSGLALVITGVTFAKFFNVPALSIAGGISVIAGLLVILLGAKGFRKKQRMYNVLLLKKEAESKTV